MNEPRYLRGDMAPLVIMGVTLIVLAAVEQSGERASAAGA
jgi:hypothetical protein